MKSTKTLRFTALDTLFFRESRPFDTIGGSELASVFPPPPRTVLGAIRTAMGELLGVDWPRFKCDHKNYKTPDGQTLYDLIGYGDELGGLSLGGLWLSLNGERLYPAPQLLLQSGATKSLSRLRFGSAVQTNMGNIRLPVIPDRQQKYQPIEDTWLTRSGLKKVLMGNMPTETELYKSKDLFAKESRLGIARANDTRKASNGMLYQTNHIRPQANVAIEVDIAGLGKLGNINLEHFIVRLGGEGRLAGITLAPLSAALPKPAVNENTRGLIIVLLTPALFENGSAEKPNTTWLLPKFTKSTQKDGTSVWQGIINEIPLILHTALIGKGQREGGWDMALHKPRPVRSLIPAGSCYYCTVNDSKISVSKAIEALHGKTVGAEQNYGRGLMACGLWNENEFI